MPAGHRLRLCCCYRPVVLVHPFGTTTFSMMTHNHFGAPGEKEDILEGIEAAITSTIRTLDHYATGRVAIPSILALGGSGLEERLFRSMYCVGRLCHPSLSISDEEDLSLPYRV